MKPAISLIAILLTLIGYVPYIRDTLRGTTTPHVYTWFGWGLVALIVFSLQVTAGAGAGAWVTVTVSIICFSICALGMRQGEKNITVTDTVFLLLAFAALVLWLVAKQPLLSALLLSAVDLLSFLPTVRKAWHKPHSETLFLYGLSAFRHVLTLFALEDYSTVSWLYPGTWAVASAAFSLMVILRRNASREMS